MGEIKLDINSHSLEISDLNIIKIENPRRNLTGLPGDRNSSWYIEAGAKRQNLSCSDCLAAKLRAGYGYATTTWNDQLLIAGFLGGGYLGRSVRSDWLYASEKLVINLDVNDRWGLRADVEMRNFADKSTGHLYSVKARFHISTQSDIRVFFSEDKGHEFGISAGFYW